MVRLKSQRRLPGACAASNRHKKPALLNSLARCVQQAKHDPEAIFELRWPARIPLARPGGAGHDGKTPWYGSNHNDVCRELAQPAIDTKNLLFSTRSLAVYSRRNMILKPSLSFAGPREYRWQGLEVPAMMGKRRGTAQITTTSAGSLRSQQSTQKTCSSQLARSLCTAGET